MGRAKRKYAPVKRLLNPQDTRLRIKTESKQESRPVITKKPDEQSRQEAPTPTSLFFTYNNALGPPYRVLIDTNFVNFSVTNKQDILKSMIDCLCAPTKVYVTDCVIAELQKLRRKYAVALKVARDRRFVRLKCTHKGSYADDCLVNRVTSHRVYIVATCDKDLKRRLRKIPGVPIMYMSNHRYTIERLPDAFMAPR